MELEKIFLWLDIDGTILDSDALKAAISRTLKKISPQHYIDFWAIYELERKKGSTVDIGRVIDLWGDRCNQSSLKIKEELKNLAFETFLFEDFKGAAEEFGNLGRVGFFSNGSFWFQRKKIESVVRFLGNRVKVRGSIISTDKEELFDKMRGFSLNLFSVYVDDRAIFLEKALEKGAVDLGFLISRKSADPKPTNPNNLVVASFGQLMSELKNR